jgi:hypothetical protein
MIPHFDVDPSWPTLPAKWVWGQVSSLSIAMTTAYLIIGGGSAGAVLASLLSEAETSPAVTAQRNAST